MTMESREPYPCIKLSRGKTDSVHVCFVLFIGDSKLFLDADQALPHFFLELSDMFSSMCGTLRKLKATDGVCVCVGKECLDTAAEALLQ